ncbi:hypothetical protein D3C83_106770 [compost metagenome]
MDLRDPIQARLLRNFEAIDALNRGELAAVAPILARRSRCSSRQGMPDKEKPADAGFSYG